LNKEQISQNQQAYPTVQAPYAYMQPMDDEINLVDLWVTLAKYKSIFLKVAIGLLVIGVFLIYFMHKDSYEVVSTVQIGGYISAMGEERPIEVPESLISKVTDAIEPSFTNQWIKKEKYEKQVKTDVSNPKSSSIILIKNKVSEDELALFIAYQKQLALVILKDHDGIIQSLQAGLLSNLAIANLKLNELENPLFLKIALKGIEIKVDAEKIKLKKLQDKEFFGIKKNQFKNKIITAKQTLNLIKGKAGVINKKLANLDESKKIIKKNIDELQQLIIAAHKNKKKSLSKATELSAMSLLLIDNEIQQNQNRLLTLEERYYVDIENERSTLNEAMQSNKAQQISQRNKMAILDEQFQELLLDNELKVAQQQLTIDKVLLSIDKKKFQTKNMIAQQKQKLNKLQTQLDNYNKTRVVSEGVVSQKSVGLSKKLLLILLMFISGFVGFMAVLIALFKDKLKQRQLELGE